MFAHKSKPKCARGKLCPTSLLPLVVIPKCFSSVLEPIFRAYPEVPGKGENFDEVQCKLTLSRMIVHATKAEFLEFNASFRDKEWIRFVDAQFLTL